MDIEELKTMSRRDFNNAMCLIGVIPFLVFVYLFVDKVASFEIFVGEIGQIIFTTIIIFLAGIILGRRILSTLIKNLIDFNQQIINMQQELIEKNRLAAITETVLTLSHEINNPLMIIRGNLELLEKGFAENSNIATEESDRLLRVKNNFERIIHVTDKMANMSKPVLDVITGDTKMIDLNRSE